MRLAAILGLRATHEATGVHHVTRRSGDRVAVWRAAQQTAMPVIGFLRSTSAADSRNFVTSFRQGLKETGFVEGKNVAIEYRYADNQLDRFRF